MKVQCPCGAKYAFDVTPEMARDPVRFACPGCGVDLSGPINELIRQELKLATAPAAIPTAVPVPMAAPVPTAIAVPSSGSAPAARPVAAGGVSIPAIPPRPAEAPVTIAPAAPAKLAISRAPSTATHGTAVETAPAPVGAGNEAGQPCQKHKGEFIIEHCRVCQKPLCPKCMELFGYVCSPLCKARADSHGLRIPVYAGQKSVAEAKQWRKIGLIGAGVGAVVVGLLGFWVWYAFIGSVPHSVFSVRFPELAYAGSCKVSGKNQLVFLHGGMLARYDLGSKKPVWTNELITKQQLDDEVKRREKEIQDEVNYAARNGTSRPYVPLETDVAKEAQIEMERSLSLYVQDQNVWVAKRGTLTRYDWDTGKPGQELTLSNAYYSPKMQGDELLFTDENPFGQHLVIHVSLASGETHTEEIGEPVGSAVLAAAAKTSAANAKKGSGMAGLPTKPDGADSDKPLDPKKVAQQAQKLPYAARVALPATLSDVRHNQQIQQELNSDDPDVRAKALAALGDDESFGRSFVDSKYGYVEWSSKMLEKHEVSHTAMKAPPAKSAMENNPSVANSGAMVNELLNQMQRDRGGDTVTEDVSKYQVTVHRPEAKDVADWVGEVTGEPGVIELKTVTVVTGGGGTIVVIDKTNKKLWQADLSQPFGESVRFREEADDETETSVGEGPCVEHGDTLYVADQATLTAFDLSNGSVRWRVPSIGIVGMFFDELGGMYVNSSTADLESIKYSRQIDINKKINPSVLKIDCKSGKVLWNVQPGGLVSHVDGKYVVCYAAHQAPDLDPDSLTTLPGMTDSVMDIRRLNPKNGHTDWDYVQQRAPLHIRFKGNTIELVFRKEVQVLKFISF
jgi:hypothetical protein